MDKLNENIAKLIEARRALSKASVGVPDPDTIQRQKELLAHYTSEINDVVGELEEEWLISKAKVFMTQVNSGASTDAAGKRMSGETKSQEAPIAKLNRLVKDAQNRITNAQSLLKRYDNERNVNAK